MVRTVIVNPITAEPALEVGDLIIDHGTIRAFNVLFAEAQWKKTRKNMRRVSYFWRDALGSFSGSRIQ